MELYTCALDNAEPSSWAAILSNRAMVGVWNAILIP